MRKIKKEKPSMDCEPYYVEFGGGGFNWVLAILVLILIIFAFCFPCHSLQIDHNWKGETEYSDDDGNLLVINAHTGNHPSDIKSRWFLPNGREVQPKGVYNWDGELVDIQWQYTGSRRESDRRY